MLTKQVKLQTAEQAKNGGYLGVGPQQTETIHSTWSAPIAAVVTTGQLTYETVAGVGSILIKVYPYYLRGKSVHVCIPLCTHVYTLVYPRVHYLALSMSPVDLSRMSISRG